MLATQGALAAGSLRHRLTIQARTAASDGQGGETVTWAARVTVWGLVEPVTGREALMAQQLTAELATVVTLRFRTDVRVTDRIVWGTRVLQIASVQDPDGRREQLRLLCVEVQ